MQLIGLLLLLSLVYLLVAGKGVKALGGIAGVIEGGIKSFISPEDPIKTLETALGAASASESTPAGGSMALTSEAPGTTTPENSAGTGHADASTPAQAARLTPASLQREIKAHKLTLPQVNADLKILYPLAFG